MDNFKHINWYILWCWFNSNCSVYFCLYWKPRWTQFDHSRGKSSGRKYKI